MLFGSVGRTDLISDALTDELTRLQYRSVRRLAATLGASIEVMPTHGFGSFCSSTPSGGARASTIGAERAGNQALVIGDEDDFVASVVSGLTAYPRYYSRMAPLNRSGPPPLDLSPPPELGPQDIKRLLQEGQWIVDVRRRADFAHAHLAGTVGIELGDSFATYVGWVLPWGPPLVLVGDSTDHLEQAQRALARIGVDRLGGWATGGVTAYGREGPLRSYRAVAWPELAAELARREVAVLDVRRDDEWSEARIEGAIHIPLHDLERRVHELPDGEIWTHCSVGFRASIAASLLDRAGIEVVLVDDDFDRAAGAGLSVIR